MKVVIQRVSKASVNIKSDVRQINKGIVVLIGIETSDTDKDVKWISDKILNLRIFPDEQGKFDKSVLDIQGDVLVVSQFTLLGDCRKGRRPDFTKAASSEKAKILYERFIELISESGLNIQTGEFQAYMNVEIHNDGPVTLILDSTHNDK